MLLTNSAHSTAMGTLALLIVLGLYFLPALIALARQRPNAGAIWVLNLLLGWSVIGWIVALVWASTTPRPAARA